MRKLHRRSSGTPATANAKTVDPLDVEFMQLAIAEANRAPALGEVPVGAVVVHKGRVIARAHNRRTIDHDPTAHAELIAMREAARSWETGASKTAPYTSPWNPARCVQAPWFKRALRDVCTAA